MQQQRHHRPPPPAPPSISTRSRSSSGSSSSSSDSDAAEDNPLRGGLGRRGNSGASTRTASAAQLVCFHWLGQGGRCTAKRVVWFAASVSALALFLFLLAQASRSWAAPPSRDGVRDAGGTRGGPPAARDIGTMCHQVQFFLQTRPVAGAVNCRWRVVNGAHLDLRNCRVRLQRTLLGGRPLLLKDFNITLGSALPSGAFLDGSVFEGTTYVYELVVADVDSNARKLVAAATAVTLDNHLPDRRSRAQYLVDKYGGKQDAYLDMSPRDEYVVDKYVIHGVKVRVGYHTALVHKANAAAASGSEDGGTGVPTPTAPGRDCDAEGHRCHVDITPAVLDEFARVEAVAFHRLRVMFGLFPVDEYRVVVHENATLRSENELGLTYPPSQVQHRFEESGEKQSHEICHAWIGGMLKFANNAQGHGAGPETQNSNKWALEGLTHLYGILALDLDVAKAFLEHDIAYYDKMIADEVDKPLVELGVYFGQPSSYSYYCKGGLFFIHIARLLRLWGNKSLNTLWRALLLNRGVTTAAQAADSTRPVSTSDLLAELKALVPGGSSDFEQAFNDYVFGTKRIPIHHIDDDDLLPLMEWNETVASVYPLVPMDELPELFDHSVANPQAPGGFGASEDNDD